MGIQRMIMWRATGKFFIFTENIQGLSSIDAVIQSVKAMLQSVWSDKLIVVISPLTVFKLHLPL